MSLSNMGPATSFEGRYVSPDGIDHGDHVFHEVGFGTTPEAAGGDLIRVVEAEIDLAEQRAASHEDPSASAQAYDGLCQLYPTNPHCETWERRAAELRSRY